MTISTQAGGSTALDLGTLRRPPGGRDEDEVDRRAMPDDREIEQEQFAELRRSGDPRLRDRLVEEHYE